MTGVVQALGRKIQTRERHVRIDDHISPVRDICTSELDASTTSHYKVLRQFVSYT